MQDTTIARAWESALAASLMPCVRVVLAAGQMLTKLHWNVAMVASICLQGTIIAQGCRRVLLAGRTLCVPMAIAKAIGAASKGVHVTSTLLPGE